MLKVPIYTQPDYETCGQTCLEAIYNYYGFEIKLDQIINEVKRSYSGGTLSPHLAIHALGHGFKTTIYINNLEIFDPSWFKHNKAKPEVLIDNLQEQMKYKSDKDLHQVSNAYQEYLRLGGKILFHTINPQLLRTYFKKKIPILTGLSATYLYQSERELFTDKGVAIFDKIKGTPYGHFVVLCGYAKNTKKIVVADPHPDKLTSGNYYKVSIHHLINAIMLGVHTNDANLLIIEPGKNASEKLVKNT